MKIFPTILLVVTLASASAQETRPLSPKGEVVPSVVFIGNSFTYGFGSPVRFYRAGIVTDLNHGDVGHEDVGGVPALFKMFVCKPISNRVCRLSRRWARVAA